MRALIIEDNTTSLLLLRQLVSRVDGCEAIIFSDPTEAVRTIAELDFDVALVDYTMPKMNGVEVIRHIRSLEKHHTVPVVMVTAEDEREKRLEAFNAGATDFLRKPVEPIEFKARLRNLLALRKTEVAVRDHARRLNQLLAETTGEGGGRGALERLAEAIAHQQSAAAGDVDAVARVARRLAEASGMEPAMRETFDRCWATIRQRHGRAEDGRAAA